MPEDEKYLNSQAELHDMIVGLLGGRAAEEIVFDTVTTGASNDIEKATSIARSMVTRYGMSKKFGLMGLETVASQYLDGRSAMNCADNTASEVDAEVMQILKEAYEEALGLLRENREIMDQIAAHLIEKETITGKEFMKIFREAKGLPEPDEKKEIGTAEINTEKIIEKPMEDNTKEIQSLDMQQESEQTNTENANGAAYQNTGVLGAETGNSGQTVTQQSYYGGVQSQQRGNDYAQEKTQENEYVHNEVAIRPTNQDVCSEEAGERSEDSQIPEKDVAGEMDRQDTGEMGNSRFGAVWDRNVNGRQE